MLKIKMTIAISLFITSFSFAQQADAIIGKYHLTNDLDLEIFENNMKYFGKIIALNGYNDGQVEDINNPDASRQNDPLIGKVIIADLEFDKEENKWINGSMYSPEKGVFFDFKIIEDRQNEIVIVGSKYFIWKTLEWKKI